MRDKYGRFLKGTHWRPHQPFREKEWLLEHYGNRGMSAADIAKEHGVTENAVYFWLSRHGIPRRSISQARGLKHWGASGPDNPMWNRRGELNPRWSGGVTAERQAFYTSREWKGACRAVWKRDNATCRRCALHRESALDMPFHIHHVVPFANKDLRADPSNLVLLCEVCHHFVHSKRNVDREYLPQV